MLSDDERRILAEIERHLQADGTLRRAADAVGRRVSWAHRAWSVLLWTSLVLMLVTAALGVAPAVAQCAGLAVLTGVALRLTRAEPDHRAGRDPIRHRAE